VTYIRNTNKLNILLLISQLKLLMSLFCNDLLEGIDNINTNNKRGVFPLG